MLCELQLEDDTVIGVRSLNPCSNGRCSASYSSRFSVEDSLWVLILVLMEDALRVCSRIRITQRYRVLILVLMEDALREYNLAGLVFLSWCLNPCSNGRCSARRS